MVHLTFGECAKKFPRIRKLKSNKPIMPDVSCTFTHIPQYRWSRQKLDLFPIENRASTCVKNENDVLSNLLHPYKEFSN